MGHSLGQLDRAYSKPTVEQLKEAYNRAEPYLSISRINLPDLDNMKRELLLSVVKQQCQILGFDPDRIKIEKEKEINGNITIDDEIEILQKEILGVTIKNKVNNYKYDHKIVTETELTDYLNQGWEIVKDLPNGKLVIKSPLPQGIA